MSATTTSGAPSWSMSPAAGEARIAPYEASVSHLAARERAPARVERQRVGVHREAVDLAAVRLQRVHAAVGGAEHQLVAVVAVEVGERRRGGAVARELLREAGQQVLVAVQVHVAPVLAGERLRPLHARHHQPHREAVGLHRGPVVLVRAVGRVVLERGRRRAGEVRARREARLQLGEVDLGERAAVLGGVRGAVAPVRRHLLEVGVVGRVGAGRHLDRARVAVAARVHEPAHVEVRARRVDLLVPLRAT